MRRLSIALVEPVYEVNVGHIARVMKNFGLEELLLINPKVDLIKARKFASHGVDILEKTKETSLDELKKSFDMIVGTTAIAAKRPSKILRKALTPESLAENLKDFSGNLCLLFGREATGLKNEELKLCDLVVSINTGTDYKTLNISHSVAILLYEISKRRIEVHEEMASREDKERTIKYSVKLARICGFQEHKVPLLEEAMRKLLGKGKPTPRELYLMMGLLREAILALQREKKDFTQKGSI
ncbi:MAG: TrmJ/YjtD family RNA methyltransferase [archaeon]|nr:TrmJ/YjtD family RNA methyltransferase [archaeon]